jgi:hypothetical protein
VKDGKLVYEANTFGRNHERLVASQPLPKGRSTVVYQFDVDPSLTETLKGFLSAALLARARPGTGVLSVNGVEVAHTHFSEFGGFRSAGTETFGIARDTGSSVSELYTAPARFAGKVLKVEIDTKP